MKLYFMMGLPTETDEDLDGIVRLTERAYSIGKGIKKESAGRRLRGRVRPEAAYSVPVGSTAFRGRTAAERTVRQEPAQRSRPWEDLPEVPRARAILHGGSLRPRRQTACARAPCRMAERSALRRMDRDVLLFPVDGGLRGVRGGSARLCLQRSLAGRGGFLGITSPQASRRSSSGENECVPGRKSSPPTAARTASASRAASPASPAEHASLPRRKGGAPRA